MEEVVGSIPTRSTKSLNNLADTLQIPCSHFARKWQNLAASRDGLLPASFHRGFVHVEEGTVLPARLLICRATNLPCRFRFRRLVPQSGDFCIEGTKHGWLCPVQDFLGAASGSEPSPGRKAGVVPARHGLGCCIPGPAGQSLRGFSGNFTMCESIHKTAILSRRAQQRCVERYCRIS